MLGARWPCGVSPVMGGCLKEIRPVPFVCRCSACSPKNTHVRFFCSATCCGCCCCPLLPLRDTACYTRRPRRGCSAWQHAFGRTMPSCSSRSSTSSTQRPSKTGVSSCLLSGGRSSCRCPPLVHHAAALRPAAAAAAAAAGTAQKW